ncbi:mersacidin family lantibiotic [Aneurinibacillus tyrosinisolvens]|uniref:mersacidin family lantibiotic n=1 Tax=Aneurinibacillus tyrosinisolvens TaxID=1443435 RepID=UPI00063EF9F5|nr:mersacidin family lantibiotic [Aneurinibacillus tyrosinisolvens]
MNRYQVLSALKENHPAGAPMVEVSAEELARVYGGGDVQAETTPVCAAAVASSANCAAGAGLVVGGAISYFWC